MAFIMIDIIYNIIYAHWCFCCFPEEHTKKHTAVSSAMPVCSVSTPVHHVFHISHMSDCEMLLKSLGGDAKTVLSG